MNKQPFSWEQIIKRGNLIFSVGMIGIVFILVLPLPTWAIDALLSLSIAIAVLIIMLISNIKRPTDFSVFPTLLLFVTLFRLGLNIATTRAILTQGDAGNLIQAFGQFVVQGNFVIGLVIFIILTIINFIVITKGAGRVAEVSARFTLDAMPGKQMSIDADLNAGIISERDARDRRKFIEKEADFYGAMDGASKFVRGDAMAGILITAINLIGGFVIGVVQMGLSPEDSVQRFSLLSVGDGLVSQIPALLISAAAGILVTRSGSEAGLGEDFTRQLLSNSKTVMMTGFMLWAMVLVPGFPKLILIVMGGLFVMLARFLPDPAAPAGAAAGTGAGGLAGKAAIGAKPGGKAAEPANFIPKPGEVLTLEIGLGLLPLVQGNMQNLLDRVLALRRTLSQEMGAMVPPITIRDQSSLGTHKYQLLLRGHPLAHGEVFCNQLMAMGMGKGQKALRGRETIEPAFGMPAIWIPETERKEAERSGYVVIDPLTVMVTHLSEILKRNLSDMISRQDVQELLNRLKETNAAVVTELGQLQISTGLVQRILQNLLREGVSVRELSVILERLCDQYPYTKNIDELSEACRALHLEIARQLDSDDGKLKVITFHPEVEQKVIESVRQMPQEVVLVLDPALAGHIHAELKKGIQSMAGTGRPPTLLCAPAVRMGLKKFFEDSFRLLKIFAYNEISPQLKLDPVYTIVPAKS